MIRFSVDLKKDESHASHLQAILPASVGNCEQAAPWRLQFILFRKLNSEFS